MNRLVLAAAVVCLLITEAWGTASYNFSRSNAEKTIAGSLLTATTSIPGAVSEMVYTVPANRDFVLTLVCVGAGTGGIVLDVSTLGSIAVVGAGAELCQTFTHGVVVPPGSIVSCTKSTTGSSFCAISGLLVK